MSEELGRKGLSVLLVEGGDGEVEIRASCHWQPSAGPWEIRSDVMTVENNNKLIWRRKKKHCPQIAGKGDVGKSKCVGLCVQLEIFYIVRCALQHLNMGLGVWSSPTPSTEKTSNNFKNPRENSLSALNCVNWDIMKYGIPMFAIQSVIILILYYL